ncbi:outer membrane beta-barrel family protein [Bacteroidia bacterium]|nr:outer membrane beta-barrel family protein [Bacteroidia bacterium]
MRKRISLIVFLAFVGMSLNAQIRVKGKILDSATMKPLADVTVSAFNFKDTALLNFTFTTKNGNFYMEVNSLDSILVSFSYFGYLETHRTYQAGSNFYWRDEDIKLVSDPKWNTLSKVKIKTSPITMRGDTIEINANRFKVLPGSDVAQLFKKIPGFQVDVSGAVKVNGKDIKKITVDGSEFFGNNPALVSKTLQADMIDKVQVYEDKDELGEVKEDGEVTINLNLKKGANNGYFGDALLGAGSNELFEAGLRLNSFKGDRKLSLVANGNNINNSGFDFGFSSWHGWVNNSRMGQDWNAKSWTNGAYNFQEKGNINNNADYGFSYFNEVANEKKLSGNIVHKTNFFTSENSTESQNIISDTSIRTSKNQNLSSGSHTETNYKVAYSDRSDSMFWYEAVFTGNLGDNLMREKSDNEISINDNLINKGNINSLSSQTSDKHLLQMELWNRLSRKIKDLSLWTQVKVSDQNEKTDLHRYTLSNTDSFNIFNDRNNKNRFYQATMHLRVPLKNNFSLRINAERFSQFNTFNGKAYNAQILNNSFEQNYAQQVDSLSSTMDNEISNTSLGTAISYWDKKIYARFGLNYTMANINSQSNFLNQETKIDNNYGAFLPRFYFSYGRRGFNRISINFNRTFSIPSGSDLLPVYNIFNIWNRSIGNPNLAQSLINNASFNFRRQPKKGFIQRFVAYLNYSQSDNYKVTQSFTDENGLIQSNPVLLTGYQNFNSYTSAAFKVYRKILLTYGLSQVYNEMPTLFNNNKVLNKSSSFDHSLGFGYEFSDSLAFNISYELNQTNNKNDGNELLNYNQVTQGVSGSLRSILPFGTSIKLNLDIDDQRAVPGIGKIVPLFHAYIQHPLDKNQKWNLKLTAYDIFKQNVGISRSASNGFVTISESNRLQQYFMLTLIYKVKKMGGATQKYVY